MFYNLVIKIGYHIEEKGKIKNNRNYCKKKERILKRHKININVLKNK
jgi:hypothetical protein